ncbi:hypothetical protein [Altericista sp. CCNU0014]|uniref:hypothetical protein n=1 Tax=Altericista sp. CCNU0014 TaxID=3082949 RepID=UPI00384A6DF8
MGSLFVLWLSYALVGWKLLLGDIVYYVAFLISIVVILVSIQDEPWIQGVFGYIPQAVTVILILSLLLTFIIAYPATIFLVVVPALSTFMAWQDMEDCIAKRKLPRFKSRLWPLVAIALLGLAFGEIVDLYFIPGGSYS